MADKQEDELMLSEWSYNQLRVLSISGGNKAFTKHMNHYDLMLQPVQNRYSTTASNYYRNQIRDWFSAEEKKKEERPDYKTGR